MVFCNKNNLFEIVVFEQVTILILIDGFLQYILDDIFIKCLTGHNPYFNRWFSAISKEME